MLAVFETFAVRVLIFIPELSWFAQHEISPSSLLVVADLAQGCHGLWETSRVVKRSRTDHVYDTTITTPRTLCPWNFLRARYWRRAFTAATLVAKIRNCEKL